MPIKRRADKRRVDPGREYLVWSGIFDGGHDFFDELPELGLPTQSNVDPDLAREPWQRFGARWMAEHGHENRLHPIWAEQLFGRPWETTDAA